MKLSTFAFQGEDLRCSSAIMRHGFLTLAVSCVLSRPRAASPAGTATDSPRRMVLPISSSALWAKAGSLTIVNARSGGAPA